MRFIYNNGAEGSGADAGGNAELLGHLRIALLVLRHGQLVGVVADWTDLRGEPENGLLSHQE